MTNEQRMANLVAANSAMQKVSELTRELLNLRHGKFVQEDKRLAELAKGGIDVLTALYERAATVSMTLMDKPVTPKKSDDAKSEDK